MASTAQAKPLTICLPCPGCDAPFGGPSLDAGALYALVAATPGRATCPTCGERFFLPSADPFHPEEQLRDQATAYAPARAEEA